MIASAALILALVALAVAIAAALLWLRTDRRAERRTTQLLQVLEATLARERVVADELTAELAATRRRDLGLSLADVDAARPAPIAGARAIVTAPASPVEGLPVAVRRELDALEDPEAREELQAEAVRLHAEGHTPAAIIAALFEGV